MSQTSWIVEGPDETALNLSGRKFSTNDDGAPMMCNLVCLTMGRHVHIDYCRAEDESVCGSTEVQHIPERLAPEPDRPKDRITHNLYWRRAGMLDSLNMSTEANFGFLGFKG